MTHQSSQGMSRMRSPNPSAPGKLSLQRDQRLGSKLMTSKSSPTPTSLATALHI